MERLEPPSPSSQTQAHSLAHRFGRQKRIENLGQVLLGNPRTVILKPDLRPLAAAAKIGITRPNMGHALNPIFS
jgi:hypothetical protein